ncbi:MAG: histone deacetylase family protein [Rhodobacteraceae bacterium]|nr:histone deacetylase family protein [Paracoccaceae bacterium]
MSTALISHPSGLAHVTPPGHPERVDRLHAIHAALTATEFEPLERVAAPRADDATLTLCHPQRYIDRVEAAAPDTGWSSLDGDTHVVKASADAARHTAGGVVAAVDRVLDGRNANAFCAGRPPGHHAETETAMGFCLFGNAAIAAKHALENRGLSRVAIVDFDVHHGNGTQDLIWNEERVFFASSHQMPLYPGSGGPKERGAHGQIVNVPLAPGAGGEAFRHVYDTVILRQLEEYLPDLILVSAGFDAHRADPLADIRLGEADFAWVTERICDVADKVCRGRVVSTLEGGYDLDALAASTAAHVSVLMRRGAATP